MPGSKSSDWTPERRAKLGASIKARYADPEQRQRLSESCRVARAKEKAAGKKRRQNPDNLERVRQRCLEWNKDPARHKAASARMKELWATTHHREKMKRAFRIAAGFSIKHFRNVQKVNSLQRDRIKNDPDYRAAFVKRMTESRKGKPRPKGFKVPPERVAEYFELKKKNRNNGWTSREVGEHMGLL